ncbi:dCTP deaminase domain-containing protein, partial [Streptomyces viridosporus]|uniref:dCTP deaminase domain-containing protein n=1 Tax=Streptomyces viridosporus TaxID=67581 RepID=UPI003F657793
MLLSDQDLLAAISGGRLGIEPFDEAMLQPASIDVRLDRAFLVFEHPIDYSAGHGRGARLLVTAASQWLHATTVTCT